MLASRMPPRFLFDAYMNAAVVYNMMPTDANVMGNGDPPYSTLGIPFDLSRIVPFGSRCVVKRPDSEGEGVRGRIIGLVVDGPGYRAWIEGDEDEIVASQRQPWVRFRRWLREE